MPLQRKTIKINDYRVPICWDLGLTCSLLCLKRLIPNDKIVHRSKIFGIFGTSGQWKKKGIDIVI